MRLSDIVKCPECGHRAVDHFYEGRVEHPPKKDTATRFIIRCSKFSFSGSCTCDFFTDTLVYETEFTDATHTY